MPRICSACLLKVLPQTLKYQPPTRINLKLIKCEFWLNFISFYYFLRNNKKRFSFMASYLLFWKTIWIEKKLWSMKIFKNNRKCSKTLLFSTATWIAFLAKKTLKFGFLYFWKSCRELNFLSIKINPESIGILSRKL